MLVHSFDPFHNLLLSSIVAAIPIILFLLCLTVFKMKGVYAALTTLIITILIALLVFKLPLNIAGGIASKASGLDCIALSNGLPHGLMATTSNKHSEAYFTPWSR